MFKELLENRHSIRNYLEKPVSEEDLMTILEAGRIAPSGCNTQGYKLLVVEGDRVKEFADRSEMQAFAKKAPLMIAVATYDHADLMCREHRGSTDAVIAMTLMMMQAEDLGISSCWLGHFNDEKLAECFELTAEDKIVCAMVFGYASVEGKPAHKKTMDEVLVRLK